MVCRLLMILIFQNLHDDRIIFNVDYDEHTIELVRVGDHKMTYGKD